MVSANTPGQWNGAIGAFVVTSVLDFQERSGSVAGRKGREKTVLV